MNWRRRKAILEWAQVMAALGVVIVLLAGPAWLISHYESGQQWRRMSSDSGVVFECYGHSPELRNYDIDDHCVRISP